jgi:anthraniloyl-CoA monooxygenase
VRGRVLTIGGGPAGLYASLLLKKADPDLEITVLERNPPDATYGWGVVFSDRTLTEFREADLPTYEAITDSFVTWEAIDVLYKEQLIRSGGHVFAGLARRRLLRILQDRCRELGVELRFEVEAGDVARADEYDLVLAADGVNSIVRGEHDDVFRPRVEMGQARYIWFGTDRVLDSFTFVFRQEEHGLFQVHAYPFDGTTSTWIVETDEATWRRAALDTAGESDSIRFCEKLFAPELRGHPLLSNSSKWIAFPTIRTRTWHHGNVVLLGDAAHTAHFSIGSGTKLAMEDAIALARGFERTGDLRAGAAEYELERKPVVERFQEAADESRAYFENTRRYLHQEPMQFAFHLFTRSGRIDYDSLRIRDPGYVDTVDRWFAGGSAVAPPPMLTPLELGGIRLGNRVVAGPAPTDAAVEGLPDRDLTAALSEAAGGGAGLVVAPVVAVSSKGRITTGCPGLYEDDHTDAWAHLAEDVHLQGGKLAIRLGHAGRRGATRPRHRGIDRPIREGAWALLAPSAIPYGRRSHTPADMAEGDVAQVLEEFSRAARRAAAAGVDLLLVHMAHGYLLHSFLSPLTNHRRDGYGGDLGARLRFPLEVWEVVREVWPADRPLGAAIPATDWARGGLDEDDAVALAAALAERGCALAEPLAGQIVMGGTPRYGRSFLSGHANGIRNEARLPTLVGGNVTTTGEANTLIAGGRADLVTLTAG